MSGPLVVERVVSGHDLAARTVCRLCGERATWEYPGAWVHDSDDGRLARACHFVHRRVRFDEGPSWLALDEGRTWNGWAVPYVTPAVRDEIAAWLETQPESEDAVRAMRALQPDGEGTIAIDIGLCFWWAESPEVS